MHASDHPIDAIARHDAERARFCLDRATFAFFRHDPSGRFTYANRKACESLGYSLAELLTRSVADIDPTVSADAWPELWETLCRSGSLTFEAVNRRKDGTTFPVEVTASMLEFGGERFAITLVQDITARKRIHPEAGTVFANETQIHQVIMNLCTNAYHAMDKTSGVLDIDLSPVTIDRRDLANYPGMEPGRYVKLTVADTGHGIDSADLAKIFDPYFTTKRAGEGTGMGLSTVHGIMKDHGGSIKVYSEPGVGTSFQILFPLADAAEGSPPGGKALPGGNESILLVDDDTMLIGIGKEMLEDLGYRVDTRANPLDAVEAFRANPDKYDLVLSDLTMPAMSGEALAGEIRRLRPGIPIILCSGFSARVGVDALEAIGVSDASS